MIIRVFDDGFEAEGYSAEDVALLLQTFYYGSLYNSLEAIEGADEDAGLWTSYPTDPDVYAKADYDDGCVGCEGCCSSCCQCDGPPTKPACDCEVRDILARTKEEILNAIALNPLSVGTLSDVHRRAQRGYLVHRDPGDETK